MSLKIAVQMDPIQRINIKGDSTFALLLEAQKRGHQLSYYTPDRLALLNGRLFATVESLSVRDQAGDYFTLDEPRRVELSQFDVVLLRQDPPFDLAYVTTTHLLERIHPKTLVVNDPAHVRNAPEKMMVTEFPDLMPPTLVTHDLAEIKAFRAEHADIVMSAFSARNALISARSRVTKVGGIRSGNSVTIIFSGALRTCAGSLTTSVLGWMRSSRWVVVT